MYEAVSLNSNSLRRSVLVSWHDLVGKNLQLLFGGGVGALIIVIPANFSTLSSSDRLVCGICLCTVTVCN